MYELWFRITYKDLIKKKKLKTIVRPGGRRCPGPKCANENQEALVRIIKKLGDETKKTLPKFDSYKTKIKITKIIVKKIKKVTKKDLEGSSPDCLTKQAMKHHLGIIYNKEFNDEDSVTIIIFSYL